MLGANKQQQPQQQAFNSTSSTTEDTNSFTTLTTTATVIHSHPSNTTAQSRSSPGKQPHQQRKRQSLRERFITLRQIVPDLQASTGSKTEAVILQKAVEYINTLIEQRQQLRRTIRSLHSELHIDNGIVDSDMESESNVVSGRFGVDDLGVVADEEEDDEAVLIVNNSGKPRLIQFYVDLDQKTQQSLCKELSVHLLNRKPIGIPSNTAYPADTLLCNFIDLKGNEELRKMLLVGNPMGDSRIIYRHYATLYFVFIVNSAESELAILDLIQVFVEVLDRCFENVCELDLIFHFDKVHFVLNEIISGGMVVETNLNEILSAIAEQEKRERNGPSDRPKFAKRKSLQSSLTGKNKNKNCVKQMAATVRRIIDYFESIETNSTASQDVITQLVNDIPEQLEDDTIGVEIWNLSARWRSKLPIQSVTQMRKAAYKLIEPHTTVVQLYPLCIKVAQSCIDSNDLQTAEEMLDKAKSFEINAPPSIEFYLTNARLEFHKKEWIGCSHMLSKAKESCKTWKDAQLLADFYSSSANLPGSDSVRWLREGYDVLFRLKLENTERIENRLLLDLAAVYMEKDQFELAESAIKHILEQDMSMLEANLLLVDLQAKRGEKEKAIKHVMVLSTFQFDSAEETGQFISAVLRLINLIGVETALNALDMQITRQPACDELYLAKTKVIVEGAHTVETSNCINVIREITKKLIEQRNGELSNDLKTKIRSLLWSAAQSLCDKERYADAEQWLLLVTNLIENDQIDRINASIVFRKIAFCQIQLRRFTEAKTYLERSLAQVAQNARTLALLCICESELGDAGEFTKHFTSLLQDRSDENNSTQSIAMVMNALENQPHDTDISEIMLNAYESLLKLDSDRLKQLEIPHATLIRCITRSLRDLMPARRPWSLDLSKYLSEAINLSGEMDQAEIDWLARMSWNLSLDMIQNQEMRLAASYIELASQFMQKLPANAEVSTLLPQTFFLSAVANLELARILPNDTERENHLQVCVESIERFKSNGKAGKVELSDPIQMLAIQIEWEASLKMKRFEHTQQMIDELEKHPETPSKFYERLTDIALKEQQCPPDLLVNIIQATLDRLLRELHENEPSRLRDEQTKQMSYERFSEWFRFLVNAAFLVSPQKALDYYRQTIPLINDVKNEYPPVEMEWLMVRAWNTSIEYASIKCKSEERQWREMACQLLEYLPSEFKAPYVDQMRS